MKPSSESTHRAPAAIRKELREALNKRDIRYERARMEPRDASFGAGCSERLCPSKASLGTSKASRSQRWRIALIAACVGLLSRIGDGETTYIHTETYDEKGKDFVIIEY